MVPAERKYSEAAQQVEIAVSLPVIEVLAASLAKADVIPDGLEHTDHLLIEAAAMQVKAAGFMAFKQRSNVRARTRIHRHVAPGRLFFATLSNVGRATMRHSRRNAARNKL